jgi:hypothetical protein
MSAAGAAPGSYIQLMEHPTRRLASYVLKVNKHFATICLMLPATELNDECPMIEVEKIRLSKFSTEFVSRVLSREYKHLMMGQRIHEAMVEHARATAPKEGLPSVWSSLKPKHA